VTYCYSYGTLESLIFFYSCILIETSGRTSSIYENGLILYLKLIKEYQALLSEI